MTFENKMLRNWVLMLMIALVALQSLSVIADVMPLHPGDAEHMHHGEISGGTTHAIQIDPLEPYSENIELFAGSAHPDHAEHCHTGHCHGSHMLVITQPFALNLVLPVLGISTPSIDSSSAHTSAILRPPIA